MPLDARPVISGLYTTPAEAKGPRPREVEEDGCSINSQRKRLGTEWSDPVSNQGISMKAPALFGIGPFSQTVKDLLEWPARSTPYT